jgi:pyruvate kinase
MNFSHGTAEIIRSARIKSVRLRRNWAVMSRFSVTYRPKIRVSTFKEGKIFLNIGDKFLSTQTWVKAKATKRKSASTIKGPG